MKKGLGKKLCFILVFTFLTILTFTYHWGAGEFSGIGFDTIISQLSIPLEGTSSDILDSYRDKALIPALLISLALAAIIIFNKKLSIRKWIIVLFFVLWTVILWINIDRSYSINKYIRGQTESSDFIEKEYVDPSKVKITFPAKKRNLIWIIMESAESSAQSEKEGGIQPVNYIKKMTEIAEENVSFSESELIQGAITTSGSDFTLGAIVAQTMGLPLKVPRGKSDIDVSLGFLPGRTNLGDILKKEGYNNYFMCGSDLNFSGRGDYFIHHGSYETFDYYTALKEGKIDPDYKVWWGFEDEKLYSFAKEKILELAAKEEPFNFNMLTADTHNPNGYRCEKCGSEYDSQYANVWACASDQVWDFLNWIKEQDFYEDTVIVISGDHCSMDGSFYRGLDRQVEDGTGTRRRVYNAFINPAREPVREKNRRFTTMDIFPSVISAMGADIEGERLGLGTNLFSSEETLSEKKGYEFVVNELMKRSEYYENHLLYK